MLDYHSVHEFDLHGKFVVNHANNIDPKYKVDDALISWLVNLPAP